MVLGWRVVRVKSGRYSGETTGAGDLWNAGFIYGLIKNWPVKKILGFANKFAVRALKKGWHKL